MQPAFLSLKWKLYLGMFCILKASFSLSRAAEGEVYSVMPLFPARDRSD